VTFGEFKKRGVWAKQVAQTSSKQFSPKTTPGFRILKNLSASSCLCVDIRARYLNRSAMRMCEFCYFPFSATLHGQRNKEVDAKSKFSISL
jgi:hypothetical protein